MKRTLGFMTANWLRKPANQDKVKRTARQLRNRFQDQRTPDKARPNETAAESGNEAEQRHAKSERSTGQAGSRR